MVMILMYLLLKKPIQDIKAYQGEWRDTNRCFTNEENKVLFIAQREMYATYMVVGVLMLCQMKGEQCEMKLMHL